MEEMDKRRYLNGLETLESALMSMSSSKASDRRKGLESIRNNLVENDDLGEMLDFNSLRYSEDDDDEDGPSSSKFKKKEKPQPRIWDTVFEVAKNHFQQVIHVKIASTPAFASVQTIVQRANANFPFLSPEPLYSFIISNLKDEGCLENFSFGSMQLLQNLLSINKYTTSFKGNHWKHIIQTLIKLYNNPTIPKTMVLETLNVCIIHGSNIPDAIPILRHDVVHFYRHVLLEEPNRHLVPTILVYKGIVLLCRYNAVEFRGILCKLGEAIIPSILSHSGSSIRDHVEEASIVDLLLVQLQLHAPCDIPSSSPAFFAEDKGKWEDIIDRIYTFAIDLIDEIAKKSGYTKNVTIPSNLLLLAVKSTKLVHEQKSDDPNSGEGFPPAKRVMTHKSFQAVVGEATHYQPCETQIVWIQYISAMINVFPEIADVNMIYQLHRLGVSLLNSPFIVREEVYSFLRSVLFAEKYLKRKGLMDKPNSWIHIWDIVIKSLQVNEAKPEALEFVRCLLCEVPSTNINSLLFLFVENAIGASHESLHLLSEFLYRCSLPEYIKISPATRIPGQIEGSDKSCPRIALLKWLVNSLVDKCIPNTELQIATALCSLMVNRSHLFIQTQYLMENAFQITKHFKMIFEDFEPTILKCCFVSPPEVSKTRSRNPKKVEERGIFCISSTFADKLFISLQDDLQQLPPIDVFSRDFTKKLTQLQFRVAVLLNLTNFLEVHKLCEETQEFKLNMGDLFDKAFHRYSNIVSEYLNKNELTSIQLHSVVKIMKGLLKNDHLCNEVKYNLARKYPVKIQDFWKNTFWLGLPNKRQEVSPTYRRATMGSPSKEFGSFRFQEDSVGEVTISERRAVELASMESLQCLIEFANNSERKAELMKSLAEDCLEIGDQFNIMIQFYMDLSMELLTKMVPSFPEIRLAYDSMMNLLQTLCRTYHSNLACSIKIWELFCKMAPKVAAETENVVQNQYMSLVGAMTRKYESYGIDVIKVALKTLSVLANVDPMCQWTVSKGLNETVYKPLFPLVINLLKSASQQVRLATVNFYCDAFEAEAALFNLGEENNFLEATILQASTRRKDLYEGVYTKLLEVYTAPVVSDVEMVEESINRTSVVILCLAKTIFVYPFNQKRVLFCLFLLIKLKSISIHLTSRALKSFDKDATKTLTSHLLYTLEKWLKLKYDVLDFPYQLFDCNSPEEFFGKYRREISFQLFQHTDAENTKLLENFSKSTSIPVIELIKECYGMIMSRLVLGLANAVDEIEKGTASVSAKQQTLSMNTLNASYNRLINIFGNLVNAEDYLKNCLDDVILNMISLTFQSSITASWDCGRIYLPEPEPPFYDEAKILVGLEHLLHKLHCNEKVSVIGYLVQNSPKKMYRILLTLVLRIHEAHDWLETFWRLHHYSFFVKLLLKEPRDVFELMRPYTCQFIVYSYLRLLSQKRQPSPASTSFTIAVMHNLIDFVKALTTLSVNEMSHHFLPIVSQVIVTVSSFPETTYLANRLLEFLLKTYGKVFTTCITSLDPFPSEIEAFAEFKDIHSEFKYGSQRNEWTLEKELQNCLVQMKTSQTHGTCTKERLRFIKQLLSQRKFDLEVLVKVMAGKRFSDECSKDIIHSLIQMLLGVIIRSRDEEIILEACRCLGEIGPIDLAVLVLPSYDPKSKLQSASNSIHAIITSAAEYLHSDNIKLVATTGDVLQTVLQTMEASDVLNTEIAKTNIRLARVLLPFKSEEVERVNGSVLSCNLSTLETVLSSLEVSENICYSNWAIQLTCGLITTLKPDECILNRLLPLCRLKVTFCEEILPYVVFTALTSSKTNLGVRKVISIYFRKFFNSFVANSRQNLNHPRWNDSNDHDEDRSTSIYGNKLALQCLIRVVQFLRLHSLTFDVGGSYRTPWDNNFWLDLNYLDLAKAAQYCGAYLSSILYSEIHAYSMKDDRIETPAPGFSYEGSSMVQRLHSSPSADVEKLLLKAYISIGESDAVYGCGSARYSDFTSNIQHLQQLNQWNRSLAAYDSRSNDQLTAQIGTCNSLKELGLFNTLWTYLKGVEEMSGYIEPDLSGIQYECGWRLSKWDLNCDKANYLKENAGSEDLTGSVTTQKSIYESIQSALNNDKLNHKESIRRGFMSTVQDLKHASVESAENLYMFLAQFQMFRMIEDFYSTRDSGVSSDQLIQNWQLLDKLGCSNLKFQESVLYLRSVLLKAFNEKENSPTLINSYDECILHLLTKARADGRLELAESCTAKIFSRSMLPRKELEVARNHWARGEQDIALSILGRLMEKNGPDRNSDIHATSLLLYGEWLSETKSENPTLIMEQYFSQSVKLYESKKAFGTAQEVSKAYITLAKYADSLYQNVSSYVKSEMFQEKIRTINKAQQELDRIRQNSAAADQDTKKSAMILQKQIYMDNQEASATATETRKFLICALRYYLRGLKYSSQHDLLIFRAIGLWLDNTNFQDTMKVINEESLPSYKYVIVLHQLSARLGVSNSNGIGEALQKILIKCAQDHPYHTLPVLLAQALMNKDKEPIRGIKKEVENDRVVAAKHLVDMLKKGPLGELTIKMEQVWSALIHLANYQENSKENLKKAIPDTAPLKKLRGLSSVPIPTISIEVSPTSKYKDFVVGINSFETEFLLVGGINSPKRITCTGTNGMKYNMLLKGQDDLRQDAVMQQVFAVMNKLFQNEPTTKARRLQIRTYKVVPLSQRSGIIEWCENTQTFGGYLVGPDGVSGAHRLYRPNDITPKECRKKLNDVREGGNPKKLEMYNEIISKFKPVFRHFFFENFKDAGTFFERRLAYTRSVATSSMVGYILGLGDRHVLNILVDKNTAEFIHIDLGVAFEQGRILPTPETVPFRLSRDVVDGMGFCGVEGDFRRSCEMTLEVLRNNAEIILTILEVLLYDPLYIWTLSADRVQKVQPGVRNAGRLSTGAAEAQMEEPPRERNNSAARVLLRLKQKLIGVEEGVSSGSTLSVPGHVALLIQRACDQSRLSRLFPGWQPYL